MKSNNFPKRLMVGGKQSKYKNPEGIYAGSAAALQAKYKNHFPKRSQSAKVLSNEIKPSCRTRGGVFNGGS
jgi:hypothetical protein